MENLRVKTKNNTNIIISHRTSSIQYADHILVLENGAIIEEGKHNDLIQNGGFYAEMHQKQTTENT